ncbi:carbohydrate binding domain-containing protein [Psychrosphaera sp. G1-22]|uniref:Carbohydrate binding domain-containing protein n=1 Tax=Psychrosphaera algicola TaxID=3023714 RepID=A0ABT5FIP6_9GAMM|nr:carbohydrate binding domain-containing protein [Psychrosphaera sp. G1-22]MDC2891056.1 carbohydrate binding domain-containing protein [Psychrosphaera sp. G1-22]
MKVVGTGTNPWDVQLGSDAVETVVGNEYVLSMWIKGEEDGGVVRFSTSSEAGALYGADETIGTSWQQVTWTFAANDVATQVVLDLGASAVTYLIDDVELIPVAAEPAYMLSADTVLLNGDLELGTDNDFDNWGKWNNGDGIVQELTEVHSGARSAKVTNGSDFNAEYQSQLVSDETTLVVGTTYSASVWIKGTVDGEVRFSTNETTPQYGATAMVTADWSQVVWEFTATEEVTRLVFDLGKTPDAVYYVDDFELVAK